MKSLFERTHQSRQKKLWHTGEHLDSWSVRIIAQIQRKTETKQRRQIEKKIRKQIKEKKYIYNWEKPISHLPSAHLRFTTSTHQRNCWSTLGISKSNELLDVLMTLNLQNLLNKEVIRKTKLTIFVFSLLCMEGCFLSFPPMGRFGLVVQCMYLVPLRWNLFGLLSALRSHDQF